MPLPRLIFFLAAFVSWGGALWGHDAGLSTAEATLFGDRLKVTIALAPKDAHMLLADGHPASESWTDETFPRVRAKLEAAAMEWWDVRDAERVIPPRVIGAALAAEDNVSVELEFPHDGDVATLQVTARLLSKLPPDHRQLVLVMDENGALRSRKILTAQGATLTIGARDDEARAPTFWAFVRLGVEHIWTGYDHLLFLLALLVTCRDLRAVLVVISCFTLAHSVTLALATLDWLRLPPQLTEAAIAASIVFVGVENLWLGGRAPRRRWLLTLMFGLVHGFGFANVLRDLGVGRAGSGLAMPLFGFNLGVEVGQIAIAGVLVPLYWRLAKEERRAFAILRGVSIVTVGLGGYWLVERMTMA